MKTKYGVLSDEMAKSILSIKNLFILWWLLLITASIFSIDQHFINGMLLPKWLFSGIICCGLLLSLPVISIWKKKKTLYTQTFVYIAGNTIITVCFFESILYLLQYFDAIPAYGTFTCGSFDNVAGFASCMVLGFATPCKAYGAKMKKAFMLMKTVFACCVLLSGSRKES